MAVTVTKLIDLNRLEDYYRAIDVPLLKVSTLLTQQMLEVQETKMDKVDGVEGQVLGFVKDGEVGVVTIKKDSINAADVKEIVNSMVDNGELTKDNIAISTLRVSTFGIEVENIPVGTSEFILDDFIDLNTKYQDMTVYSVDMSLYAWYNSTGLPITIGCQYMQNKLLFCNHGTEVQHKAVFKVTVLYRENDTPQP